MEYDVLGCRVKVDATDSSDQVNPDDVVAAFRQEAQKIQKARPHLDQNQVAILVALKFAEEKLSLEGEYRENVETLQARASHALESLENLGEPERVEQI